jgi:hypothetical protein
MYKPNNLMMRGSTIVLIDPVMTKKKPRNT